MITDSPGHLKGFSYIGLHRYSLTFCTDHRRKLFVDNAVVDVLREQLLRASHEQKFSVIAYCFMPDHLHLLVEGTSDDSDAKRFIKGFKHYSGFYYCKRWTGPLWQRYGFEHVIRDDEGTLEVARYILAKSGPSRIGCNGGGLSVRRIVCLRVEKFDWEHVRLKAAYARSSA